MSAFDRIPAELREMPRWVVWRWGDVDPKTGKPKKPPFCPTDLRRHGSSTNSETWATFEKAVAVVEAGKADGIGFALSPPWVGVDLDEELPEADRYAIALALNSYTEESVSGTGLHVIVRANLTNGRHPEGFGVFQEGRLWYCSGEHVTGTPTTIEDRQAELDAVLAAFLPSVTGTSVTAREPVDLDDQELVDFIRDKYADLWDGRWESQYGSQSEADLGLCNRLAWVTGNDAVRIDRLFRSSGLYRAKWERENYRSETIKTAIARASSEGSQNAPSNRREPSPTVTTVGGFQGAPGVGGGTNSRTVGTVREDGTTTPLPTGGVGGGTEPSRDPATVPDTETVEDTFIDPTVTLSEFVASVDESASEPLLVCDQGNAFLRGSLGLLVAKTGDGKTTLAVAFTLHASAGLDFAGFRFPRPLRVLVIQNEGPREAFRQKLEAAAAHWTHAIESVRIWDEPDSWGSVKVSVPEARARLRRVLELHNVDIVIVDTLTRYGVRGNGTPEETREFIEWLTETGLGRDRGFLLLHHPITRPDASLDLIERIAGAWAPHADVVFYLEKLADKRARLSSAKLRWAREDRPAVLLGFDPSSSAFTFLGEQSEVERDYLAEVKALLGDATWRTVREIASREDGGIGADYDLVKGLLEDHPDEFESRTGEAAKALGRKPQATLWQLRDDEESA